MARAPGRRDRIIHGVDALVAPEPPNIAGRAASRFGTLQAILFDMDGVITDTAGIHAAAWKVTFDEYLRMLAQEKSDSFRPFDVVADYKAHVDGKPRYDGVRDFLKSRARRWLVLRRRSSCSY